MPRAAFPDVGPDHQTTEAESFGQSTISGLRGRTTNAFTSSSRKRIKRDIFERYLRYLCDHTSTDLEQEGFVDSLRKHFELLPSRYFVDVNHYGTEILEHQELLQSARRNPKSVAFKVRDVEAFYPRLLDLTAVSNEEQSGITLSQSLESSSCSSSSASPRRRRCNQSTGLRPSFPSSSSLQNLITELCDYPSNEDIPDDMDRVFIKEVIVAAKDAPQLLTRVTRAMSTAGLNIREAHAFNTTDGFSFDVFVVDSGATVKTDELNRVLENEFRDMLSEQLQAKDDSLPQIPNRDQIDDWEIAIEQLRLISKLASSTFGHVYKGVYYGQEIAVKIIKDAMKDEQQYKEFLKEVSIMKKVRHRNVIQFIGARTEKPSLCILMEYMDGGSVQNYLRQKQSLPLSEVFKIALDVARGMDYLHRRNIIHRDLKTANLLIDSVGTVKIADFGVARIMDSVCCNTAETGTYRWMAPEVIEHKPYDTKADVYSFGILLWELVTGQVPYSGMTPLQAAVSVVHRHLRPPIPEHCPVHLSQLICACWTQSPDSRPDFSQIHRSLIEMSNAERQASEVRSTMSGSSRRGKLLSKFKRSGGSFHR